MQEIYREVFEKVPFNNFRNRLEADRCDFPDEIGGNCVYQARLLVDRLKAQGFDARILFTSKFRHVAVLGRNGDELFYMDPSLLHVEPIALQPVLTRGASVQARALPENEHVANRMEVSLLNHGISVKLKQVMGEDSYDGAAFLYDLSRAAESVSDEFYFNAHQISSRDKRTLRLPFLADAKVRQIAYYPGKNKFEAGVVNEGFYSESSRAERKNFNKVVETIAEAIGIEVKELLGVFEMAV